MKTSTKTKTKKDGSSNEFDLTPVGKEDNDICLEDPDEDDSPEFQKYLYGKPVSDNNPLPEIEDEDDESSDFASTELCGCGSGKVISDCDCGGEWEDNDKPIVDEECHCGSGKNVDVCDCGCNCEKPV